MTNDTARADGPWGRVYGERCDSGGCPASAARRSRVMKRQTVRAEWRVAERLNLTPELPTIRAALPPAADQVGDVGGQHPGGWRPLQPSGAGRRVAAQVGVDGRAADPQLPGHGGDGRPLRMEPVEGLIDRDPAGVPGRPLGRRRRGLGAPAPSPVHGRDGHRASGRRERHGRPDRGGLQRRSVVEQEGFQDLTEVLDEMEAIDHLHGLGCPPANAVGIEVTPIAADHADRRMLRPTTPRRSRPSGPAAGPRRDESTRSTRMVPYRCPRRQAHSSTPTACRAGVGGHRGRPHQAEEGGWTGREPQTGGEPGAGVPAEGHADRPQDGDQSMGFAGIGARRGLARAP